MKKILKNKEFIILTFFLIVSFLLRFINFQNRWQLSYDQARDVIVASYALNNHLVPLIGPFSSAGKFIYGPQWYWILYTYISVNRNLLITPWTIHAIIWVIMTFVMYLIGKELFNKNFGLLLAFLFAISWSLVNAATNLISPSMVGVFSIISLYFFIKLINYSRKLDAFLLSFFVANTINIHFQAIGLIILLPVAFAFSNKNIKNFLLLCLGFFIPLIPLILFDLKNNFFESKNLLDYYFYGQNRLYVPNRWLTYAGVFWPKVWSSVIGVKDLFGYILITLLAIFVSLETIRKKIDKKILALLVSFLIIFTMLRYYKGELFENYVIFLYPFILIFSSWVIYKIFKFNKPISILFFLLITFFTIQKDIVEISLAKTATGVNIIYWKNKIEDRFPKDNFAVYLYKYQYSERALPIVLYLNSDKRISDKGRKIGIEFKDDTIEIVDLKGTITKEWVFINPSAVYRSVEEWYK